MATYCYHCGAKIAENHSFCPNCGILNSSAEERRVYGLSSPCIRRRRLLFSPSLGLYTSNKRIFIVRAPLKYQALQNGLFMVAMLLYLLPLLLLYFIPYPMIGFWNITGLQLLGYLFMLTGVFGAWRKDYSPVSIEELENKGAYEIVREEISRIELKDRGFWGPSKIAITTNSGKEISAWFSEHGAFRYAANLIQRFSPALCIYR